MGMDRLWLLPAAAILGFSPAAGAMDAFLPHTEPGSEYDVVAMTEDGRLLVTRSQQFETRALLWDGAAFTEILPIYQRMFPGYMTADGSVIAGRVFDGQRSYAARWTADSFVKLDGYGDGGSAYVDNVAGLSADGSVMVGTSYDVDNVARAFRWTTTDGISDLLALSFGGASEAKAVSADGSIVVGNAAVGAETHAFRWNGAMLDLTPDAGNASASHISADGAVIAGTIDGGAFRWTETDLLQRLGGLGGSTTGVLDMSPDGSVLVGVSSFANGTIRAVRWTGSDAEDLRSLGGVASASSLVSDNGKLVFGIELTADYQTRAFRWTESGGMKLLTDVFTEGGLDVSGWDIDWVKATNADGTILAGTGTVEGSRGFWLARCERACALLRAEDVAASLAGLGAMGATASLQMGSELAAAGDMAAAAARNPSLVTGFAYGAFDSDPTASGSVGATVRLSGDVVLGATLGVVDIRTNLPNGGSSELTGAAATGFVAARPDAGFSWLLGATALGLDGRVTRPYLNGNTVTSSSGDTTATGFALGASAGWTFKDVAPDLALTPFVSAVLSAVDFAGYTESEGPFPASIAAFSTSSALLKAGLEARYDLGNDGRLTASIAYGHNFGDGGSITADIAGITALSVKGATLPADFIEVSAGLELPLTEQLQFNGRAGVTAPFAGALSVQGRAGFTFAF